MKVVQWILFATVIPVLTSQICAILYDNGDFSDDDIMELEAGFHDIAENNPVYDKQTSAIEVMKHCQLIGYKTYNKEKLTGEEILCIGPICSEISNRTRLEGTTNNAITHVNCSCQIESCSKISEHVVKDQDVGWTTLSLIGIGIGIGCFGLCSVFSAIWVYKFNVKIELDKVTETVDINPEYGGDYEDRESEIRDTNDYYFYAKPEDDIEITDKNDYYD
jgi:hypothetical protein